MPALLWDHLPQVQESLQKHQPWLIFTDFDGTLSPIVDQPSQAVLAPEMRQALLVLVQRPHIRFAVVSGRSLEDIRQRVDLPGIIHVGNHGLEIAGPGWHFSPIHPSETRERILSLAKELEAVFLDLPGVLIENKSLTVSLHYRCLAEGFASQFNARLKTFTEQLPAAFAMLHGHCVVDFRPHVQWNKGDACLWIKNRLGLADAAMIYIGDDRTDEDAFAALPNEVTIVVGFNAKSKARFSLADPSAVRTFWKWLADQG